MALHILQNLERLPECQATAAPGDAILLIDRAVYLLSSSALDTLPCPLFALQEDLELAGITRVGANCEVVDYAGWVKLTEVHCQHVAWN